MRRPLTSTSENPPTGCPSIATSTSFGLPLCLRRQ